jgi:hypothetical protein
MSKTTRKGMKIKIPPLIEWWIEQEIEGLKEEVKKGREKNLFRHSQDKVDITGKFRDFLLTAEKNVEMHLWDAKAFVTRNDLGKEIDSELSQLFSLTIMIFNNLLQRFDAKNLSEDLLNHLKRELKILSEQASRLFELQSISNQDPQGKERAKKLIETFRSNLFNLNSVMEPYLKKEETKETL